MRYTYLIAALIIAALVWLSECTDKCSGHEDEPVKEAPLAPAQDEHQHQADSLMHQDQSAEEHDHQHHSH